MKCPKCGFIQPKQPECSKCGVIFEKYEAFLDRKRRVPQQENRSSEKSIFSIIVGMVVVVGVSIAVGLHFMQEEKQASNPLPENSDPRGLVSALEEYGATSANSEILQPLFEVDEVNKLEPEGLAGQLAQNFSGTGSPVESARNATVSIVTPWGSGSGFFIDRFGTIITNRHVVQYNADQLEWMESQFELLRDRLQNERENLDLMRSQLKQVKDTRVKRQVSKNIVLREEQYSTYHQKLTEMGQRITKIKQSDFLQDGKVILVDGSEYSVSTLQLSPEQDLALLSIDVYNSPAIPIVKAKDYPEQGAPVFTIGSPMGLHHSVTSGVISGYRTLKGKKLVQVDAPINPGNSGGPLINVKGQVVGVNTMIINNTEGIGFAIPFETVLEEFPGVLNEQ